MARPISGTRVVFRKGRQRAFVERIKAGAGLTWKALAATLGVSTRTLKATWLCEETTMPLSTVKKMLKLSPYTSFADLRKNSVERFLPKNWGQVKGGKRATWALLIHTKKIRVPSLREPALYEFVGIVLGDGHISKKTVEIVLNASTERAYVDYICTLSRTLFSIDPAVRLRQGNSVVVVLSSVRLVRFLQRLGLESGGRGNRRVLLPEAAKREPGRLRMIVRGLVDTDGGIFDKQKGYRRALIEFKNANRTLRNEFARSLKRLGFTTSRSGKDAIRIQNQNEVLRYIAEIGTSNEKNRLKFVSFKKYLGVPKSAEILHALERL